MTAHSEWLEKIIAKYSGDLVPDDSVALDNHILSCRECAQAMSDYQKLKEHLLPLEDDKSAPQLPPRMLKLKREIAQTAQEEIRRRLLEETDIIINESFRRPEGYPVEERFLETAEIRAQLSSGSQPVKVACSREITKTLKVPEEGGESLNRQQNKGGVHVTAQDVDTVFTILASILAGIAFATEFELGSPSTVACGLLVTLLALSWLPWLLPKRSKMDRAKRQAGVCQERKHLISGRIASVCRFPLAKERMRETGEEIETIRKTHS